MTCSEVLGDEEEGAFKQGLCLFTDTMGLQRHGDVQESAAES